MNIRFPQLKSVNLWWRQQTKFHLHMRLNYCILTPKNSQMNVFWYGRTCGYCPTGWNWNREVGALTNLRAAHSVVRIPAVARNISPLHNAQTGDVPQPASCSMTTGVIFSAVKRAGCKNDNSLPSSVEIKNKWSYTLYSPNMPSWRGKGNFNFF
jgi:hypothetical protein